MNSLTQLRYCTISEMTNTLLACSKSGSKFNDSNKFITERTHCLIDCNVELNNIEFNTTV